MSMVVAVLAGLVALVFAFLVYVQIALVRSARAMQGKDVGALPGRTGHRIAELDDALVYFFSPQCGACRTITPRVRDLARGNDAVFAVDVMSDMDLARALRVRATPSTVEIHRGKIVGYHVGVIPPAVMQRFARG